MSTLHRVSGRGEYPDTRTGRSRRRALRLDAILKDNPVRNRAPHGFAVHREGEFSMQILEWRRMRRDCIRVFWCKLDYPLARQWGAELERSGTIASGAKACDVRWRTSAGSRPPVVT